MPETTIAFGRAEYEITEARCTDSWAPYDSLFRVRFLPIFRPISPKLAGRLRAGLSPSRSQLEPVPRGAHRRYRRRVRAGKPPPARPGTHAAGSGPAFRQRSQ